MDIPPLPPGFVLDSGGASQPPPPLPPGFVMENPTQAQAETEAAAMPVQNPNRFRARAPQPETIAIGDMRQPENNLLAASIMGLKAPRPDAPLWRSQIVSGLETLGQGPQTIGAMGAFRALQTADRLDRGERVPDMEDPLGLAYLTPEQRAGQRAQLEEVLGRNLSNIARSQAFQSTLARDPNAAPFVQALNEGRWSDAWRLLTPGVVQQLSVESLPNMVPPVVGGAVGGPVGAFLGGMAADAGPRSLNILQEAAQKAGVNVQDPAAIRAWMQANPQSALQAQNSAGLGSVAPALLDAATAALARPFTQGASVGAMMRATGGNMAREVGFEGAGEAAAGVLSGQGVQLGEIAAEMLGAGPASVGTTIGQTGRAAFSAPVVPPSLGGATTATQPPSMSFALPAMPDSQPPGPQSVGAAATPGQVAELSSREALAMRTQAEMQDIFTPPRPGDFTEYVPGVGLTRAEVELTPTASREAKVLRIQKPERFADLDRQRSDAYANFFDDMAGSETLVMRAKEARESQGMPLLNRAFANAKAVWTAPVLEKIDQILSSADGKRSLIASELKAIRSRIIDEDGKLETNPALLYGVRQHINDKLSAESKTLTPLIKLAEKDMLEVRSEIDRAIEQAAPGFTQFLRFWEEASRPIDVMEEMLAARKQIFKGSDRHVAFHDFDRVMKGWASERGAPGANAAKSFTDDQWQKLMNMWRSLQRTAEAERLARAPGSDTAQNLFDFGRKAATVAGHVFGAATLNPLMNVATAVGGRMVKDWRTDRQVNKMLNVPTRPLPD